ncbi:MAG TPA: LytTR family DNA-binding domain-containing protein [Candidatus Kapabacteria bacterium]|nr:LytTR family DNA-binding domain-containing protein [Candidatus Kapabacteria bacterium]
MAIRVIIADDEPAARERLRDFLEQESDVQIVAECTDGFTALSAIVEHSPDLIFLDIRMPSMNGFEVIRQIAPRPVPPIIYVSAHGGHALEAFDVSAVDYLLKPFDRARFLKALRLGRDAVQRSVSQKITTLELQTQTADSDECAGDRLAIRSTGKITLLVFSEILWINGAGNYIEIRVGQKTHLLRQTLSSIALQLPSNFIRISKSQIVNIQLIRELRPKSHGDSILTLHDGTELTVTRSYRQLLREKLKL